MAMAKTLRSTPEVPASVAPVTWSHHPHPPAGVPSIWDLALAAEHARAEAARIDSAAQEAWAFGEPGTADHRKGEAMAVARGQESAIMELAEVLPAMTLRDAAALLAWSDRLVDDLGAAIDPLGGRPDDLALHEARSLVDRLQSILTNVVPVVAAAAGAWLSDIDAERLTERRLWQFGPVAEVSR